MDELTKIRYHHKEWKKLVEGSFGWRNIDELLDWFSNRRKGIELVQGVTVEFAIMTEVTTKSYEQLV